MKNFSFEDEEEFEALSTETKAFYQAIGEVWCPYFGEGITFTAQGWEHLKFKARNKARVQADQYARMKLLHLAPEILKKSHTVQGISPLSDHFEFMAVNSRWEWVMRKAGYWEFIAVLENVRVCIVVKQVDMSPKYFWSIIPLWTIDRRAHKRILHGGFEDDEESKLPLV